MKTPPLAAIMFAFAAAGTCRATLEFSGFMQIAKESKFAITDPDRKTASGWIAIGQSFEGFTLIAFNREKELLTVKNGDSTIELPLKLSRVREGQAPVVTVTPTPAPIPAPASDTATQLAAAKEELTRLRTRYKDGHPTVQALLKKIAELEARAKQ